MNKPAELPATLQPDDGVTVREVSQVFVAEELVPVQNEHPELLESIKTAGGYIVRLRNRHHD